MTDLFMFLLFALGIAGAFVIVVGDWWENDHDRPE